MNLLQGSVLLVSRAVKARPCVASMMARHPNYFWKLLPFRRQIYHIFHQLDDYVSQMFRVKGRATTKPLDWYLFDNRVFSADLLSSQSPFTALLVIYLLYLLPGLYRFTKPHS